MENTPVVDEVVVPKKNILFEVTTVSKVLATVLFIILPFVGFWIGLQYGNLQTSKSILTQDSIQNDVVQDIETENTIQSIKEGPESIKPTFEGFMVVGANVVYQTSYAKPQVIDGLDIQSFESLNVYSKDNPLGLLYAKDTDSVFVGDHLGTIFEIEGADPQTFAPLENNFARDSSTVYTIVETGGGVMFNPRIVKIPGADAATFSVLGSGYAKDKSNVYFSPWNQQEAFIVKNADPLTFQVTNTPSYYGEGFKGKDSLNNFDFGKIEVQD